MPTISGSQSEQPAEAIGAIEHPGTAAMGRGEPMPLPSWAFETGEVPAAGPDSAMGEATRRSAWRLGWRHIGWMILAASLAVPLGAAVLLFAVIGRQMNFFHFVAIVYQATTLYLPIYLACAVVAVLGIVRWGKGGQALRRAAAVCAVMALGLAGLRIYATHIEPYRLQIRQIAIGSPKIKAPLRILHISDIQAARVGSYEERVVETIKELNPDFIVHTGDLVQPIAPATLESEIPKIRALLDRLEPPYGKYHVMGDVDRAGSQALREREFGMSLLESEEAVIQTAEGTRIRILGLSLEQSRFGRFSEAMIEEWLGGTAETEYTIVMGHAPDYIRRIDRLDIDLCLAGHTHGGQIRIPGWGPITWASGVPRELARGFHEVGSTRINVSAGIGSEHSHGMPSIRFYCPPEMTLITLTPDLE